MRRLNAIQRLRENLLRRRGALCVSLDTTWTQLDTAQDRDVGDSVDVALDAEYHEISSQLAEVESNELAQINIALNRMRAGKYGVCEDCDRNIPLARLQAVPYATVCIKCQRDREVVTNRGSAAAVLANGDDSDLLLNGNGAGVS